MVWFTFNKPYEYRLTANKSVAYRPKSYNVKADIALAAKASGAGNYRGKRVDGGANASENEGTEAAPAAADEGEAGASPTAG